MLVGNLQGPTKVNSCYTLSVPPSRGCSTAQPLAANPAQLPRPQAVTLELRRGVAGAGVFPVTIKEPVSGVLLSLSPSLTTETAEFTSFRHMVLSSNPQLPVDTHLWPISCVPGICEPGKGNKCSLTWNMKRVTVGLRGRGNHHFSNLVTEQPVLSNSQVLEHFRNSQGLSSTCCLFLLTLEMDPELWDLFGLIG